MNVRAASRSLRPAFAPRFALPTLPSRIAVLHDIADLVEEMVAMFGRWNDRRRTVGALRGLTHAQLNDIGLDGADLNDVATRLIR